MKSHRTEVPTIDMPRISPHHWVGHYADYLYNFAITRVNNSELAKDLVQDTFLAALEQVEKFEARSSERTWLTAILRNKLTDVYRKNSVGLAEQMAVKGNNGEVDLFKDEDGELKESHQPPVFGMEEFDPFSNIEFNQVLSKCMKKLPALWLAVFTMKHIDEQDTPTICSNLKVTPANFWVIMHRSRVNLRTCLQNNWI